MNLVFCGTYTDLTLQTGIDTTPGAPTVHPTGSDGIYVFRHDVDSGELTLLHTTDAVNPSFLAMDKQERFLFAVNETREFNGQESGAVSSFAIDRETGDLRFLNQVSSGGVNPCHLSVSDCGGFILVANWNSASIAVIPIAADGRLSPLVDLHVDETTDDREAHAHFITPDPDGGFVLATDTGTDRIMIYRQNAETGRLTPNTPPWAQTHPGGSPRHLSFSPDGRYLFANGEADLTLSVFRYDAETGTADYIHNVSTLPEGIDVQEHSTSQMLVHPGGRFVYVANRGMDTIAMFRFDADGERAVSLGFESTRGTTPRNFMIDPAGQFLYVANQNSDSIERFATVSETGFLDYIGKDADVPAPTCIQFTVT